MICIGEGRGKRAAGDRIICPSGDLGAALLILDGPITRSPDGSVGVLAIDRPDCCRVLLERIKVDHPIEDDGIELAAVRVTFFLGYDRTLQTKLGIRSHCFAPVALGWAAQIHVLVLLRDTQRDTLVQIVFGEALRSRIHHARQTITVADLLIEE